MTKVFCDICGRDTSQSHTVIFLECKAGIKNMKFKGKDINNLLNEEESIFETIETGEWISEGKYETQEIIFKYQDKYYRIYDSRSGSYFTEYHYDREDDNAEIECEEVAKVEVITTEWRSVK